jgi:UDP-glucose-4-epimerase GalE
MKNNYVLVTGGAGYVGSHACKILRENDFVPITFDNFSTGHREFVKWGPIFEGDLLEPSDIESVFDEYKIESVMHFAAKAEVNESINNPIKYYRENILGSMNLLETFVRKKGKIIIFSSSCATYGNPGVEVIHENTPQNPINPYGISKFAIEKLIIDLQRLHGFNYSILRYFNAAGADKDLETGENHVDETHVIPLLIKAAASKGNFKIYGKNYETFDGTAVRDYVHVSDIAFAHLKALQIMLEERKNIVCNLGTGTGTSVLELVNRIMVWKKDFTVQYLGRREGDPSSLIAANNLSKELLQIEYKNSDINLILENAISYWEKNSEN